ncbi:hypothetical protein J7K19_07700 [bacterium]|nr:hypothetical protein [bacterium]
MTKKMAIVSINWNIITRVPITPKSIWELTDVFRTEITDQNFLRAWDERLTQLGEGKEIGSIDVRISCLLYRKNSSVDTLSFGHIRIMRLNEKYYDIDLPLLKMLLKYLPKSQQELVVDNLNIRPSDNRF